MFSDKKKKKKKKKLSFAECAHRVLKVNNG